MLPEEPKPCPICFGRGKIYKFIGTKEIIKAKELQRIGVYNKEYKPKGVIIDYYNIIDCTCKTNEIKRG